MCNLPQIPEPHHSADAIATSLCYLRNYLNSSRFEGNERKREHYEAGCDYLDNKEYETAINTFKETINIDPVYTDAHCGLGRAYLVQNDLDRAETAAKTALRLAENNHPDSQKLLDAIECYRSGRNAVNNKQFNEAITEFQKSIHLEPFFMKARYELGRVHLRLGNLQVVKHVVEEALKLADDYPSIQRLLDAIKLYNTGLNFLNGRRYNEAKLVVEKALHIVPTYQDALELLEEIEEKRKLMGTDTMVLTPGGRCWIDQDLVTNAQYLKFVDSNPQWRKGNVNRYYNEDSDYLKHWDENHYVIGEGDKPVIHVSWDAARAYAQWIEKRLPTAAELQKLPVQGNDLWEWCLDKQLENKLAEQKALVANIFFWAPVSFTHLPIGFRCAKTVTN